MKIHLICQFPLVQLLSGRCHKAAANHIIDPSVDPVCRRCNLTPHTTHIGSVRDYSGKANRPLRILGSTNLPLSVLPCSRRSCRARKPPETRDVACNSRQGAQLSRGALCNVQCAMAWLNTPLRTYIATPNLVLLRLRVWTKVGGTPQIVERWARPLA